MLSSFSTSGRGMTVRGSLPLLLLLSCFTFTFFFVSQSLWTSQSQTDSSASSSYESMDITPSFYYVDQVYDQTDENPVVTDKDVIGISEVGDKTLHRGQMWSETKALEQEEIRTRINRVCQARGSSLTMSIKKVIMMVDPTHKIAFCRHAKAATSTWLNHFLLLSPASGAQKRAWREDNHLLHIHVPPFFNPQNMGLTSVAELDEFLIREEIFTFSFVRHPFSRLVSAFENKVLYNGGHGYVRLSNRLGGEGAVFADFVAHVLSQADKLGCDGDGGPSAVGCSNLDVHWRPQYARCGFCQLRYDFIGRVEQFDEDVSYVFRATNLTKFIPMQEADLILNSVPHKDNRTLEYFKTLSSEQKERLLKLYKGDFDLFGYSAEEYL